MTGTAGGTACSLAGGLETGAQQTSLSQPALPGAADMHTLSPALKSPLRKSRLCGRACWAESARPGGRSQPALCLRQTPAAGESLGEGPRTRNGDHRRGLRRDRSERARQLLNSTDSFNAMLFRLEEATAPTILRKDLCPFESIVTCT